jgi:hypothetical protein
VLREARGGRFPEDEEPAPFSDAAPSTLRGSIHPNENTVAHSCCAVIS